MRKPNLFIVGAPKSGTTALSTYLSAHPNVFFSNPKEPQFFATDYSGHGFVRDLDSYLHLFDAATSSHKIIAEGSVFYLSSQHALNAIKEFNKDAKILIMLRNPIELAQSLHQHYVHALYEDQSDFEAAWRLQDSRIQGRNIPRLCRQPKLLQYRNICMLGAQVEIALNIFDRNNVKIIFFDDFIANTSVVYKEVLGFLEIEDDHRKEFPRINEGKSIHPFLLALLNRLLPMAARNTLTKMRFNSKLSHFPEIVEFLIKRPSKRTNLNESLLSELKNTFSADVVKLGKLTHRNLQNWL